MVLVIPPGASLASAEVRRGRLPEVWGNVAMTLTPELENDFDCLIGMAVLAAKAMGTETEKMEEIIARIRKALEEAQVDNDRLQDNYSRRTIEADGLRKALEEECRERSKLRSCPQCGWKP